MEEYAVIGWPLGHTMSPAVHNASFAALGLACRLGAVPLPPDRFDTFMEALPRAGLRGVAVTIPYKERVLPRCASLDDVAAAVGAANTLLVEPGGAVRGFNTDGPAATEALRAAGAEVRGARVLVLGAGGAARAVCLQLLREGAAALAIANRTAARAARLAADLGRACGVEAEAMPLGGDRLAAAAAAADIVVNTTAVGMCPRVDETPLPASAIRRGAVVMDIVYNPVETRLLREARGRGARAVPGTEMLILQAAAQEGIWLGATADLDAMRRALTCALGRSP
ncbi:MAG: shikimate dehydrogenase [bacterium]|nr:shikimate dehydrogenase [bacterium]